MRKISREQAAAAMAAGEFGPELTRAAPGVVIILTQSWCPQWTHLRPQAEALEAEGTAVFYLEYDREDYFEEFMAFKEDRFRNDQVPYLRYYRGGALVGESNYVSAQELRRRLGA